MARVGVVVPGAEAVEARGSALTHLAEACSESLPRPSRHREQPGWGMPPPQPGQGSWSRAHPVPKLGRPGRYKLSSQTHLLGKPLTHSLLAPQNTGLLEAQTEAGVPPNQMGGSVTV